MFKGLSQLLMFISKFENKIVDYEPKINTSPIFKSTVNRLEEILEYIGLKNLHAISQISKWIEKVAAYYFHEFYSIADAILNGKD